MVFCGAPRVTSAPRLVMGQGVGDGDGETVALAGGSGTLGGSGFLRLALLKRNTIRTPNARAQTVTTTIKASGTLPCAFA